MASSANASVTDADRRLATALAACLGRHARSGQRLVVALSGGVDSIVLLHLLTLTRARHACDLTAVHVHHGLSANADAWAAFCRDCCEQLQLPCRIIRVDVQRGTPDGLEAAARRARYAALETVAGDWLLLAQHRNDQAETLLFNLLRGGGVAGAAAMRERNGRLLRPFLGVGRDDIETWAKAQRLAWVEDESNSDTRHARNFLRRDVLPTLLERFPAATKNFAAAAGRFAEALDLLDQLALVDCGGVRDFPLPAATLNALDEARARNVLRYLLTRRGVMIASEARLRECVRQMRAAAIDRHPALRFGQALLVRRRGQIQLEMIDAASADASPNGAGET